MLVNNNQSHAVRGQYNDGVGTVSNEEGLTNAPLTGTSSYSLASPSSVSAEQGMGGSILLAGMTADDQAAAREAKKAEEAAAKAAQALADAEEKSAKAAEKVEKMEKIQKTAEAIADAVVETIKEVAPEVTIKTKNGTEIKMTWENK